MQPTISSLISSARKAVKFLQRDFVELEILQGSQRNNEDFCNKSYLKLKNLLISELQKHTKSIFFPEDNFELKNINDNVVLLVNPLDSLINFSRSLPFFALSITYLTRIDNILTPTHTVMYFPILNEIYYAGKGKGAWLEKISMDEFNSKSIRLRIAGNLRETNSLIAGNNISDYISISPNLRFFGSHCYETALFLLGKLDAILIHSLDYTLKAAFELIIKEAGGKIIEKEDKFIGVNNLLINNLSISQQ